MGLKREKAWLIVTDISGETTLGEVFPEKILKLLDADGVETGEWFIQQPGGLLRQFKACE